ncbi:M1 family metallopeptidase [Flavobacterium frigidarium]|uniref:M1 family metallopeptidase n=1 Tax=Flavobacterium frigidarium TaxID=99286 RepID=UPI0030DDB80A
MIKYLFLFITTFAFSQQLKKVDFTLAKGDITINASKQSVRGFVTYNFRVHEAIDTIKIDAQNMTFENVLLDDKLVKFDNNKKELLIINSFKVGEYTLSLNYTAQPKQALYFIGSEAKDNLQIWTQGQGRYTSNWFPSFDDVNEKMIFSLRVAFNSNYQVISNGRLTAKSTLDNTTTWNYEMQQPMSSYLLMLAIGKYSKKSENAKSGVVLENYYEPRDSARFEPTYRFSKEMFDYLEKQIGVKYPWEIYRQIPARDFLYAGMENTTATILSSRYVVDSTGFEDRSYTNVNAHELAHQWFGDLVTAESGKHHWLQEGFATYYALLAEASIYGDDYFYYKMYESAQQIKYASRTDTAPVLDAKASSLSFYQKGAWALFVIHESIGDRAFKKAIRNYLKKCTYKNVTTDDLFNEIKKVARFDTEEFSKVWLESIPFNTQQANELLLKNKTMQLLFEVDKLKKTPLIEKEAFFTKILESDAYFQVKIAIVNQLKSELYEQKKGLLLTAMATNNIQVRQVVAASLPKIPADFKTAYETLLHDKSYQTQELALYYLWNNFPNSRVAYLNESKDWIGFNDYNLRTLWLSLALTTAAYDIDKKPLIEELINYSSLNYEATTRQNALEKLITFKLINDTVLENLVSATTHHMWQFSKYGRDTIRLLLKNPEMVTTFERILPTLNESEYFQLNRLLLEMQPK